MSTNPWISSLFGLTRGFDEFHNLQGPFDTDTYRQFTMTVTDETRSIPERAVALLKKQSAGNLVRNGLTAAYRQFDQRDDKGARLALTHAERVVEQSDQYFLFVNLLEPHLPYDPPPAFRRRFVPDDVSDERLDDLNQNVKEYNVRNIEMSDRDFELLERLYDAEIRYADSILGSLLETIRRESGTEETLVVVVSDHGENIGDHGLMGHNYSLHQTLLQVPFVIRLPGHFDGGSVEDARVSTLDLPATIADVLSDFGVDTGAFQDQQYGCSLVGDVPTDKPIVAEYLNPVPPIDRLREACENPHFDVSTYDRTMRAVLNDDWKFITRSDGTTALYDLHSDPSETTDVVAENPDSVDYLSGVLDEWVDTLDSTNSEAATNVGESVEQRLEELGYL